MEKSRPFVILSAAMTLSDTNGDWVALNDTR